MREPWFGSQPAETPITITLSYKIMKRVLAAIVRDRKRMVHRDDPVGVELLIVASDVIGEAIDAPAHRRLHAYPVFTHRS